MYILGIESTCDETAASVVKDGKEILSSVIATQIADHQKYGGVFPELAARRHIDAIIPVIHEALQKAGVTPEDIDLISVAKGPGLIGALLVGVNAAKALSLAWNKPFIGINHVEAHLYAAMMPHVDSLLLPAIGVVVSGGHTLLLEILSIGNYRLIGTTVDDAIGEAFDKVASLLKLPYPGGPEIEKMALEGNENRFLFSPGKVKERPFDFSFSGLKTNVLYTIKNLLKESQIQQKGSANDIFPASSLPLTLESKLSEEDRRDIAASFQKVALNNIVDKALEAAKKYQLKAIYLGGGVSNSQKLRNLFEQKSSLPLFFPPRGLSLDNAVMIAGLAYHKYREKGQSDPLNLEAEPRIACFN
jgi:N6-L-threonylcarbamoyladenine synthase